MSDATPIEPLPEPRKRSNTALIVVLVVAIVAFVGFIMCSGIMVALLLPAIQAAREAARRNACANNVKQIEIALANYHDKYQSYPPAYVADANGQPMHSWRVLILPYLEANDVYTAYNFDEPWDGPNNSKLADRMPEVFRCPSNIEASPLTNYVAVVGADTAWPGAVGRKRTEIHDGQANTIQVVEAGGSGIHWMEPRDLTLDEAVKGVNAAAGPGIMSNHPGGANVGFCDAHVLYLPEDTPPDVLRALFTVDGNEDIRADAVR
jgi:prepilin-type processing-associated H-X9-DG protein